MKDSNVGKVEVEKSSSSSFSSKTSFSNEELLEAMTDSGAEKAFETYKSKNGSANKEKAQGQSVKGNWRPNVWKYILYFKIQHSYSLRD